MAKISINVRGLDKALKDIKIYEARKLGEVKQEIARTALAVDRDAKRNTPVDTGRLRSSIAPTFRTDGLGAEVGTNVEYAEFVEFGTSRQRPQPFLYPAAEGQRQQFLNNLKAILSKP